MGYLRGSQKYSGATGARHDSDYKLYRQIPSRVSRLERVQAQRKPELKHTTAQVNTAVAFNSIQVTHITGISEGTSAFQRTGDEIRIKRIEVRGNTANQQLEVYLLSQHDGSIQPIYSDFTPTIGGMLVDTVYNNTFTEWEHSLNRFGANGNFHINKFFKYPPKVHFVGSTATSTNRNRFYIVVKNDSGASVNVEYTARIWFTDV